MTVITCIEDQQRLAEGRVPRMFYDYVDAGSWTEATYRSNEEDFRRLKLRQRVGADVSNRSTRMDMLGHNLPMPVALAPIGLAGMQHANGEILAAQAAEEFGIPFTLSTMSICSIEDVASHTTKPFWFQLYVMRDKDFIRRLIGRAKIAQCSALMITLDLQLLAQRHKDLKNGLSAPPKPTINNIFNMLTKPSWCWNMLKTKRRQFGNIVGHVKGVDDMSSLADWTSSQFDPSLRWEDLASLRNLWDKKLIIKGIMDKDDAIEAVRVGADAIVVSNHGGRQLDGTISSIRALPQILDAIGEKCEVWIDGGIRSGQDILRAIAVGARGTLIGRAYVYGLGASGKQGVSKTLGILQKELDLSLGLCGKKNLKEVDGSILHG
ncbi:MAG: alpha-hydroxy-acid oxidizing enzyme [Rhodospirillaceae bacterium TMED8]|nr:alpha-hydroxy-acid oxidizing enzyme [Magnetovibrio sp.]OUT51133.1 MAG: alpha-hydroxy-acid oxidizing enzyme [Rhodospirillaceae bacterium TMED8]|tara:strand:- start:3943 stop:5079 length:1137 start_codon:yes stop_codon:yes gene_type:complete